jgi:acyl-CoA thioester hydrolase
VTSPAPSPSDFPLTTFDKLRYADTDRQGHVNNAVFATALETGRVELLYAPDAPLADPGCAFVIASLHLDFLAELSWPGTVEVGTRVAAVGRSSLTLDQGLFQAGRCVATARTVIVQMNERSRRAQPLGATALRRLGELRPAGPAAGAP